MGSIRNAASSVRAASRAWLILAAVIALLVTFAPTAWAQTDDSKPDALGKQRTDLYVRATHTPLANLENDVNHIAVLSETCRVKSGSSACGLPDKALESDKLEERYAYYVKQPVEAHAKVHPAKIDRRNWAGSASQP
ncbi:MAG: hypothetical protein ACLQVL_26250 [Terriglobia bacterium]